MFGLFKSKTKTVRVPLEVLSVLWTEPDKVKTSMDLQGDIGAKAYGPDVSCPHPKDPPLQQAPLSFNSMEIQGFYGKYVAERVRGESLGVIVKLMQVLDEKGDCPSIVKGDHETPEEYVSLGRITLTEHSLNVASQAFDMLNSGRRILRDNTAEALIAALGHDIGKIPDLARKEFPGHTFCGVAYLKPLLETLESAERILEAVRLLHVQGKERKGKNKKSSTLQILAQADMQARLTELGTLQSEKDLRHA